MLIPLAAVLQESTKTVDGILGFPLLDFVGRPVERIVVGGGVSAISVGHRLDEGWAFPFPSPFRREPGGEVHGDGVHPIDPEPLESVCAGLLRNGLRCCLLLVRDRDGVEIVGADEHCRRLPNSGEVHA